MISDITDNGDGISFFVEIGEQRRKIYNKIRALNKIIERHLKCVYPIYNIYIYPQNKVFIATIPFETESDFDACEKDGAFNRISDYVYTELKALYPELKPLGFEREPDVEDIAVKLFFSARDDSQEISRQVEILRGERPERANPPSSETTYRSTEDVRRNVMWHFQSRSPLHDFWIQDCGGGFGAVVFLKANRDVESARTDGTVPAFIDFIMREWERAGYEKRDEVHALVEFDSDENVQAQFGGSYFARMR